MKRLIVGDNKKKSLRIKATENWKRHVDKWMGDALLSFFIFTLNVKLLENQSAV